LDPRWYKPASRNARGSIAAPSEYYPRFGFLPSMHFGIGCEYEVPEDVFMVKELQPGYLRGSKGTIKYHDAFNSA
jgi:putative acetyltransferase